MSSLNEINANNPFGEATSETPSASETPATSETGATSETEELAIKMLRFVYQNNMGLNAFYNYSWARFLKLNPGLTAMTTQELKIYYHCDVIPRLDTFSCLSVIEQRYLKMYASKIKDLEKLRNILENNEQVRGRDFVLTTDIENDVPNVDNADSGESSGYKFIVEIVKPKSVQKKKEKDPLPEDFTEMLRYLAPSEEEAVANVEITTEEALSRFLDRNSTVKMQNPADAFEIFNIGKKPDDFIRLTDRCDPRLPEASVFDIPTSSSGRTIVPSYSSFVRKVLNDSTAASIAPNFTQRLSRAVQDKNPPPKKRRLDFSRLSPPELTNSETTQQVFLSVPLPGTSESGEKTPRTIFLH